MKDENFSSFQKEAESATGKGARAVQLDAQIAENIPEEVRNQVRDTPVAEKQSELLKLARLPEEEQVKVAEKLASGNVTCVRQAVNQCRAEEIKAEPPPLPDARRFETT